MKTTHFTVTETTKLPESLVKIVGEVDAAFVLEHRAKVLKRFQAETTLPGFRKGHVPENILIDKVGAMNILHEAAEEALGEVYADILESQKIFPIGNPEVSITKLAENNPLGFTITVATLPEFKLPDYTSIAKKKTANIEDIQVTDKDIEDVVSEIRKNFAHAELHKSGKEHDHDHPEIKDEDLPVWNDEFVKTIGDFQGLEDFNTKARENLTKEKEKRGREKKRNAILEEILSKTEIVVPQVVIESELQKMLLQFEGDIEQAGANMDDYLKHVKKTRDDIKKEWRPTAEKKAKMQLILNKISEEEKIQPDNEKVRSETEKIMILHPDADPMKARLYVAQMFLNEQVMEFLENQK